MSADRETTPNASDWNELISAIAARRDRQAFAKLFYHFAPRIKTLMMRSGATQASAEELAQEAMLTVWRKAALYEPARGGPSAWIFTIARNLRTDALRRETRGGLSQAAEIEMEFEIDPAAPADAQLESVQSELRVRRALSRLSPEQIRVVELSFFEDKPHAEIARILGIPLGTVKSRLRLATNRLRNLLSDEEK